MLKVLKQVECWIFSKNRVMLLVEPESFGTHMLSVLACLSQQRVLMLSLTRPAANWIEMLASMGVKADRMLFIQPAKMAKAKNAITLKQDCDLNEISIAITEAVRHFKPDVVILENSHYLELYYDEKTISRFFKFTNEKLSLLKVNSVFVGIAGVVLKQHPELPALLENIYQVKDSNI